MRHDSSMGNEQSNIDELMEFYDLRGNTGKAHFLFFYAYNWILQTIAQFAPHPAITVALHKLRGVKIGSDVYIGPFVTIDLLYPSLVQIDDNVTIGMGSMIFAHSNAGTARNIKRIFPRVVKPIRIYHDVWIGVRTTILAGVTIEENCLVGACSLVNRNIPPRSIASGNPVRILKRVPKEDMN